MDLYFIRENKDQIVPTAQEILEMACVGNRSSPADGWLDWGATLNERFGTSNKTFAKRAEHTCEIPTIPCTEYCYESSGCPNNSKRSGDFSSVNYSTRKSLHSDEHQDFQLQSLCQSSESLNSMQQMDNIFKDNLFMTSFMNEDPCDMDDPFQSICGSTPFENLLTDMLTDSPSIEKQSPRMGGSKYLTASDLPSMEDEALGDWEDDLREEAIPACSQITNDSSKIKGPLFTTTVNTSVVAERQFGEEESLEATVLQEFEVVMTKLQPDTRICLRDALYRLANRSANPNLETSFTPSVHDDRSRCVREKNAELETNAIDRAVMNLMFNRLDTGPPDFSCVSSIHDTIWSQEYHLNQPQVVPSHIPISSFSCEEDDFLFSDRENKNITSLVPVFSKAEPVEVCVSEENKSSGKKHGSLQ